MAMRDWVRLPSKWIEEGHLADLRWKSEETVGSDNVAALMVLSPIAHNADDEGLAKCTYDQLCLATGLSRSKVSNGLSVQLGIFPHHASVPNGLRLSVEFSMKASLISFVVCTSTLAQGVNLPIRYLIVTGVYQGGDRILVRDFHNLIGRAGRAGMHTEGSIIFADTKVFDKRRQVRERWRWRTAKELLDFANSEPSSSSISAIFQPFEFGQPTRTIAIDVNLLHTLVFDDETTVECNADRGYESRRRCPQISEVLAGPGENCSRHCVFPARPFRVCGRWPRRACDQSREKHAGILPWE
jgi:hypothetical protein